MLQISSGISLILLLDKDNLVKFVKLPISGGISVS